MSSDCMEMCLKGMDLLNCSSRSSEKKPLNQLVNNALGFDIWTYQKHFQMCMTVWSVAKELKFSQLRTNPKMLLINLSWPPQSQTTTGSAHLFHFLFWSILTTTSGMCICIYIYIYVCIYIYIYRRISVEPGDPSKCPWITSAAHCICFHRIQLVVQPSALVFWLRRPLPEIHLPWFLTNGSYCAPGHSVKRNYPLKSECCTVTNHYSKQQKNYHFQNNKKNQRCLPRLAHLTSRLQSSTTQAAGGQELAAGSEVKTSANLGVFACVFFHKRNWWFDVFLLKLGKFCLVFSVTTTDWCKYCLFKKIAYQTKMGSLFVLHSCQLVWVFGWEGEWIIPWIPSLTISCYPATLLAIHLDDQQLSWEATYQISSEALNWPTCQDLSMIHLTQQGNKWSNQWKLLCIVFVSNCNSNAIIFVLIPVGHK